MTLKSALEDVTENTLKAISGVWARLEYIAGLRSGDIYEHWGLSRLHGQDQAQQALKEAHRSLLSRLLRTSIAHLTEDIATSSKQCGMDPATYVENLQNQEKSLLPLEPGAASERHLSSVLKAVSGLVKTRKGANPPTS